MPLIFGKALNPTNITSTYSISNATLVTAFNYPFRPELSMDSTQYTGKVALCAYIFFTRNFI